MAGLKPILLLLYQRPEFTQNQLSLLLEHCKRHQLYISIDGPSKKNRAEVEKVKEIVAQFQYKFTKKIIVRSSEKNFGCRLGVQEAIDWFFEHEDSGIILEDDCVPVPSFFRYTSELLDFYVDDMRVGMISGTNPEIKTSCHSSYFFSNQSIIWGWATWKNRWQAYHHTVLHAKKLLTNSEVQKNLLKKTTPHHLETVTKVLNKKIDTWDYIWYFTNLLESRYCIIPKTNLISNVGFGVMATHTHIKTTQAELKTKNLTFPLEHPHFFTVSLEFEKRYLHQVKKLNILFSIIQALITSFIKTLFVKKP